MRIPPLDPLLHLVATFEKQGLAPAVGGSGLLVALGLADTARDWDVTVDAEVPPVVAALEHTGLPYRDGTDHDFYATERRYVVDGGDHDLDLLVNFAIRTPGGTERLPARVTGRWRGVPLADPAVWARAYRLMNRPAKAETLERWLADRP
ncbi:hypothetical protein [Prauserella shujinwangii]|uniref:hypothetical protein n=1 Tax=Prauserella shujinwangii TaxID=1453103 RepID=UPI0011B23E08|nr:hypothetical protein [Prauserella shujinwangii]